MTPQGPSASYPDRAAARRGTPAKGLAMPIRIRPIRALLAGALTTLALAGLAAQAGATSPGARGTLVWGSSTGIYAGDPGDQEDTQHRLSSTDFIGSNADAPSWSPDGTKIAYSAPSYQGGVGDLGADGRPPARPTARRAHPPAAARRPTPTRPGGSPPTPPP